MTTPTRPHVTALLVSHDGVRWLPTVLDALAAQTHPLDDLIAADASSSDGSVDLLRERLGAEHVLSSPSRAPFAESVRRALSALPPAPPGDDAWVWLLHDDSAPAPDALERLLDAAAADPGISVLGPKLREWPSLRRLLELGVTISGTGRRETGLERGEYDQGQHDRRREVLAVNTAGMLVRRSVLADLGFDDRLGVFGADLDFGWRAARAGHRTLVVPDAVVFHAEAAARGVRRTALTGRRFHRAQRAAALYTLLVNGSAVGLPWRLIRLFAGSLLRALGFLLVRSPGEAYDELAALGVVYLRPDRIVAARRRRRRSARVRHRDVRHLLAPPWVPYRHGLDFVSDIAAAMVNQAGDVAEARRARSAVETGPVDEETENLESDTGLVARLVASPVAWAFAVLLLVAASATRGHLGEGFLSGGALLPAPDGAGHWWRTAFAGRHDLGVGSAASGAAYLLPLALAGTLLFGKAWLVVDLLFFLAVPLAAWGAFRFLRRITGSWQVSLWGGVAYGLLPVLSGAVQQGRLGSVVAALVLPWLAHAALFLVAEDPDRRWRAAFRTALWLALLTAFAPVGFALAVTVAIGGLAVAWFRDRGVFARGRAAVPVALALALLLLLPWALFAGITRGPAAFLLEAGRPASWLTGDPGRWDLALGRATDLGAAPGWLSVGVLVAAVAALLRADTRGRVLGAWGILLVGLAATALLAGVTVEPVTTGTQERVWLGVPLLVAQAAGITAAAVAGAELRVWLRDSAFGWRQPTGVAVALVALTAPLLGIGWWAWHGTGDILDRRAPTAVPAYMTDDSAREPEQGVLVVRGSQDQGFGYLLLRQPGLRLGDDTVLPSAEEQQRLTQLVGAVASSPTADDVRGLLDQGVQYVYAERPVDQQLAGNLDTTSGVGPASALVRGARAWKLDGSPPALEPRGSRDWYPWLVAGQLAAVVVVAVFAAPSRRRTLP